MGLFGASSTPGRRGSKTRLNKLFTLHACLMAAVAVAAIVFPEVVVYVLHSEGTWHARHEGGSSRLAFIVMRVLGCLLLPQSWILLVLRGVSDGQVRRAVVQAYALGFTCITVALVKAQLTEKLLSWSNWGVIAMFGCISVGYVWFALVERISVFEGLDKMVR